MPPFRSFYRHCSADLLKQFLAVSGTSAHPDEIWKKPSNRRADCLVTSHDAMPDEQRERLECDIDRLAAMSDEAGHEALLGGCSNDDLGVLESLENRYSRALWTWLNRRSAFDLAESIRFADDRRGGQMWSGFHCPTKPSLNRDRTSVSGFEHAVARLHRSRQVVVEICDRVRLSAKHGRSQLVQLSIYVEGLAENRIAISNGVVIHKPDRPVVEAALIYDPTSGVIDVVARSREHREPLAAEFTKHLLASPDGMQAVKLRKYELDHLRRRHEFPHEARDGIEAVHLVALRLMPFDTQHERIDLTCRPRSGRTIWDMAQTRFGDQNPLTGGYGVTRAELAIKFRTGPGGGRPAVLPIAFSAKNGCNLKERTEREQVVGEKYLKLWGLVRDV